MIKGVNRQVVEIAHPDSAYFEKVLFFVKPEYTGVSENKLKSRADMLIKSTSAPPDKKGRRRADKKIFQILKLAAAAVSGAAAAEILSFLF